MARKIYRGINNRANEMKRFYIGVGNKARRAIKIYVGIDDIARLCYKSVRVTISYITNLKASFTSKVIYTGEKYIVPTISPANSQREDFWFDPSATAKHDKSKKYIDYPWCAFADINSYAYEECGYAQDLLAQHYRRYNKTDNGDITSSICEKDENHSLQHVYVSKYVTVTGTAPEITESNDFATIYNSKNEIVDRFWAWNDWSSTVYPGMVIQFHARHSDGLANVGSDGSACWVKINGNKVSQRGSYYYKIPNNTTSIKISLNVDYHWDGGQSWQITVTTTEI